jgi:hypothetical protein
MREFFESLMMAAILGFFGLWALNILFPSVFGWHFSHYLAVSVLVDVSRSK